MKYFNHFVTGALAFLLTIGGATSCTDSFLEENGGHLLSEDLLKTEEGALAMAAGLYGNIRWHFGYEWAYGITLYGTDEFTSGNDLTSDAWNEYDSRFGPVVQGTNRNCPQPQALWDEVYYGIASCNTIIAKANIIKDEKVRNRCLAHAYFLRGYNYYRLTAQYGGVVLQLTNYREGIYSPEQVAALLQDRFLDQQYFFGTERALSFLHKNNTEAV